ncbi:Cytochrome P450,Cytochrome P450, E-class, group IV,Cytochrome P450, conserved site [Cinara cedri]|uniref:Cytochrome P450,Cytochrome P450, E-class, group IV,Cytochrome P450, conserved site n=1 Tax=Cinara cedri TaxID=506608 RepID=A0A5E4N074_9HEMI|nr:Cytochrome P450,Cytochrome P450, E-class, group IV,Cytochrome P450, conserved site [Cinara cedri]
MITFETLISLVTDINTWTAFLLLMVFGLYFWDVNKSSAEYRRQIVSLPSLTKTHWARLKLIVNLTNINARDILPIFYGYLKNYGSLVHFEGLAHHYVIMNNPDDIKILLSDIKHITKGPDYKMLEPWLNTGLLTSTDEKWHSRRKLLTNTFHFKILESYVPALNKHSLQLVKNLVKASALNDGIVRDVESYVSLCALDIVCETIMGVNLRSQEHKSVDYVKAIKNASNVCIQRIFTFWYWNETIFNFTNLGRKFRKSLKLLHGFTENVIKERRDILKNGEHKTSPTNVKKRVYSFLDLLIETSNENPDIMTDKDIREEVDTFLFEGHDTSSIAMTMAIVHLGLNRSMQDSVRDELYGIFGDSDRHATMEDLKAMVTLDRVIKETMRLYPSVSGIMRMLKEPLYLNKYTIPPKTVVVVSPHILHRDENTYPEPEVFNPDRFLPEQCAERHPFAYLPFSAGPRNCIGQKFAIYQMKMVLSTILRYVNIETLGTQQDIAVSTELVLKAEKLPNLKLNVLKTVENC